MANETEEQRKRDNKNDGTELEDQQPVRLIFKPLHTDTKRSKLLMK